MIKKISVGLVVIILAGFGAWGFLGTTGFHKNVHGIRLYNPVTDKQAIHKMFADEWYWLVSDYTIERDTSEHYVNFMLDNKSSAQYEKRNDLTLKVLEKDGKAVGFSATYYKSKLVGHILFIVVDKDARGKGYAKALVNDALQNLFAQGCVKVSLDTRTGNTRARSLYSSLGFQLLETDDDYVHFAYYKNQPIAKKAGV